MKGQMNGIGRIAVAGVALLLAVGVAAPAAAGGWATIELDAPPGKLVAGEPVTIGFQVLQHAHHPAEGDQPQLVATHRTSGERIYADGAPEGAAGHYTVTATFPSAGSWKWNIASTLFGSATAFEALEVVPPGTRVGTSSQGSLWKDLFRDQLVQQEAEPPSGAETVQITIDDGGFWPAQVQVPRGTTVEWTNTGGLPHQVMGTDLAFDDSNLLKTQETFRRTLTEPGTYTYLCGPHQNMVGTVTVT